MIGAPAPMKFPAKLITAKSIFYGRCLVTHKLPLLNAMIYILLIYYHIMYLKVEKTILLTISSIYQSYLPFFFFAQIFRYSMSNENRKIDKIFILFYKIKYNFFLSF